MDKKLVEILACPLCKGKLLFDKQAQELVCKHDKLAYPIEAGIPAMLVEKARTLTEAETH